MEGGGSPLQNLIVQGKTQTKISAIRIEKGIDTGPVYLKRDLNLSGTAREIFIRAANVIEEMISDIIDQDPKPKVQEGPITTFKRRRPQDGNIAELKNIEQIFDFIRMLDCEGYPNAFMENKNFKFEFSRAALHSSSEIIADVRIIKKINTED